MFWGGDVARTGAFSLLVFIINLNKDRKGIINYIMLFLSLYFIVFSASKTALVALLFVLFIVFIKKIYKINFLYTLLPITLIGFILFTIIIAPNLTIFNQTQLIQYFLNMNSNRRFQNARLWLWKNHLSIFKDNILFGEGDFSISELYEDPLAESESKLTYIIARDGMFGILFILFLFYLIYYSVKQKNYEAYMISSTLFLIMFFYGAYINGYDFIFITYLGSLKTSYLRKH
ncbi:O-antigen ligase family protein [Halanaerobium saccharolyticum]|uniref:O-antigen ligase family protein n=1 Tax=Halanaerobium saccharolyticum TaxID=43595 RepID=UPI003FCEBB38